MNRMITRISEMHQPIQNSFDAELGWKFHYNTPYGERPRTTDQKKPLLSVFGDSFVFGDEVDDTETWEEHLSSLSQADILNFGISGYGTDQAYLYFKRVLATQNIKTPIVALGITLENINRIGNVYRKFYSFNTGIPLTKPRFILQNDQIVLMPNPIQKREDLKKLEEIEFLEKIAPYDIWVQINTSANFKISRPFYVNFFKKEFWDLIVTNKKSSETADIHHSNLWEREEVKDLMEKIILQFVREVKVAKAQPMLIIIPYQHEGHNSNFKAIKGMEVLLQLCRTNGIPCFNGIEELNKTLVEQAGNIDSDKLWAKGGHLSSTGCQLFSKRLWLFIQAQFGRYL